MSERDEIAGLLGRIALKDRTAFDQLYILSSPKLFGVCCRLLSDRHEAEDALQDIYIKIWNKAGSYRPGQASAMGWLFTIARYHCIDRLRTRRLPDKSVDEVFDLESGLDGPEDNAMTADDRRRIDICLSELESDKARAVKAAYIEGYSYAELSARYKVPMNTVKTWLRRSLIKLRKCLER